MEAANAETVEAAWMNWNSGQPAPEVETKILCVGCVRIGRDFLSRLDRCGISGGGHSHVGSSTHAAYDGDCL